MLVRLMKTFWKTFFYFIAWFYTSTFLCRRDKLFWSYIWGLKFKIPKLLTSETTIKTIHDTTECSGEKPQVLAFMWIYIFKELFVILSSAGPPNMPFFSSCFVTLRFFFCHFRLERSLSVHCHDVDKCHESDMQLSEEATGMGISKACLFLPVARKKNHKSLMMVPKCNYIYLQMKLIF